jgi:hypothetical protein
MPKKIYSFAVITLLCCGFAAVAQQPVEWSKLDSSEGRFRALTPSKAEKTVGETPSGITIHTFSSSNKTGTFMISYADYANAATSPAQEQTVLDKVRDGVLKGTQAALVSETKLTLNGHPGREMQARKIIDGAEMILSWRLFLVGTRLYQLAVGTTKADSESPEIKKFFRSFELVN